MPHTPSAKKHIRKTEKRRLRNRVVKKTLRTHIKRVIAAVAEGNAENIKIEVVAAVKKLDKAAAKRVIHPNLAARKKSQLARLVNTKAAAAKTPEQKPAT